jgi:hypothetical protein
MNKVTKAVLASAVLLSVATGGFFVGRYSRTAEERTKTEAQQAVDEFVYQLNKKLLEDAINGK